MRKYLTTAAICCAIYSFAETARASPTVPPIQFFIFCHSYPADCRRPEPRAAVDQLPFRQLNTVNAVANAAIIADDDPTSPWDVYPRRGNCGDYAVSKRHALLEDGWPSSQVPLAEVVLRNDNEHHLVLVAYDGRKSWVLDNLSDHLLSLDEMAQRYILVRVQSTQDPKFWQTSLP